VRWSTEVRSISGRRAVSGVGDDVDQANAAAAAAAAAADAGSSER